jgi:hypothetical protein
MKARQDFEEALSMPQERRATSEPYDVSAGEEMLEDIKSKGYWEGFLLVSVYA